MGLLILGGCRLWTTLFPGDEALIRQMLAELADAASVPGSDKPLSQMANAAALTGYFTEDIEVRAKGPRGGVRVIQGRPQLQQVALSAQAMGGGFFVRFEDIIVELQGKSEGAECRLTAVARLGGEPEPWYQILAFQVREVDGDWKVARVETVDAVERIE